MSYWTSYRSPELVKLQLGKHMRKIMYHERGSYGDWDFFLGPTLVLHYFPLYVANSCQIELATSRLRSWQTRTHWCVHIVAHDVSWAAQTGKHLLRTQNVSEHNQKHVLCPGHKICVRNKCCARGQTGKHLCPQQCVLVCQGLYTSRKG